MGDSIVGLGNQQGYLLKLIRKMQGSQRLNGCGSLFLLEKRLKIQSTPHRKVALIRCFSLKRPFYYYKGERTREKRKDGTAKCFAEEMPDKTKKGRVKRNYDSQPK